MIDLRHGDCLEVMPSLVGVDAVVSDPPYGINLDTDYQGQFSGGVARRKTYRRVEGDDKPFDPSPWIGYPKAVLFGANCFSDKLPMGTWLVWCKKRDNKLGVFMADCEVAWQKGGHGVYMLRHIWDGFDKESERGEPRVHPTQKPVAVMRWVIERLRLPEGATILDPYMGSGSTGVAAVELGYNFIGIERDAGYFAIAQERIHKAQEAGKQLEMAV